MNGNILFIAAINSIGINHINKASELLINDFKKTSTNKTVIFLKKKKQKGNFFNITIILKLLTIIILL